MSRIGKGNVTQGYMKAFDALSEKGGARISREEAKAVAEELRAAGDGDAAFAAEAVYDYVDNLDAGPGAQTTGKDFGLAHALLKEELKAIDENNNGISRAEFKNLPASLQPMVSALVQMARLENVKSSPGRKSIRLFQAGVDHTVALLKGADGGNKRLSDDEAKTLTGSLMAQGRGTEALAAQNLFTIASKQDGAGDIVGHDDLDKAAAWAMKSIKKRDEGGPGFSKDELADMPPTWAAFFRLGVMSENNILRPVIDSAAATGGVADLGGERPFSDFSKRERYDLLAGISNHDEGGVANTISVTGLSGPVRNRVESEINETLKGLQSDFAGAAVSLELSALTRDESGVETTRGFSALFDVGAPPNDVMALEVIFDEEGKVLGRNLEHDVGGVTKRAELFAEHSTWDVFLPQGWTADVTMSDQKARDTFLADPSDEAAQLAVLARSTLLSELFTYRRDYNSNQVDDGQGSWRIGKHVLDGKEMHVAHWSDIDDSSYTLYFRKDGDSFVLDTFNYDN